MPTTAKVQQCLYTNTTQYHYKLTSQLYTGPLLAANVNINTVRMSISVTTPGEWEEACTEGQQTKTAYAKCACLQARRAPGPRLPRMRILFPASFMLQPAGNSNNQRLSPDFHTTSFC